MPCESDTFEMAPFPPMTWNDCDWWDGSVDLSFGAGAALSVTPYDPSISRLPEAYQCDALTYQIEEGDQVFASVLAALRPHYGELRPRYHSFLGEDFDSLMPAVNTSSDLARLIDLRHVHIHPWTKNGIGYVGLQFGCTWDQEHGLGCLMHLDRVVKIGGADVSFACSPAEADEPS